MRLKPTKTHIDLKGGLTMGIHRNQTTGKEVSDMTENCKNEVARIRDCLDEETTKIDINDLIFYPRYVKECPAYANELSSYNKYVKGEIKDYNNRYKEIMEEARANAISALGETIPDDKMLMDAASHEIEYLKEHVLYDSIRTIRSKFFDIFPIDFS